MAIFGGVPRPESFSAEAFNPVPESENRIHADDVARAYGFRGGLVPGVVVSAYLLHPAAVAWGRAWLERGRAHAVVRSPVYDGEEFRVEVKSAAEYSYEASLVDTRGAACAAAEAFLPDAPPEAPPARRGDPPIDRAAERPIASREVLERLRESGLGALRTRWSESAEISRYLRDPAQLAPVFREQRIADPSFLLGLTNWVLAANVRLSPWLHLETHSQHFGAVEMDTPLVVEASIADLFGKKGHEFVDVDVDVYAGAEATAVMRARLRAIYQLRDP